MSLSLLFDFFPLQDYSVPSWSLPSPELHCLHTWTSFSHRPLFLRLSVRFIRLLSCTFVFEDPLFTWLPAHLSVCPSSWTSWWSSASLKSSHSFLLSAFRSCSVCRVRESDTSQRISSLHTVHPEGNMSERLSRSVDQWQLPHFNNGK